MIDSKTINLNTKKAQEYLIVFVLLAIAAWVAHFWFSSSFGLYEDDYFRINKVMEMDVTELWRSLNSELFTNGRPFHYTSIILFSFIGNKLGGLLGIYWMAYLLFLANCYLFYLLLKHLFDRPYFTIIGSLSFCLFPVNTTQTWLAAAFGIQISLTFLLLALHSYILKKKWLAYVFSFGCLLSYETFFLIFWVAPLINQNWNYRRIKEIVKHTLIILGMIIALVIVRKFLIKSIGVVDISPIALLRTSFRLSFYGSLIGTGMFFLRAIDTLLLWNFRNHSIQLIPWSFAKEIFIGILPIFIGLFVILSRLKIFFLEDENIFKTSIKNRFINIDLEMPEFFRPMAKLFLIGLIMIVLSYPLALTMSPMTIDGRDSRVHLPASIGISIVYSCIFYICTYISVVYKKKIFATLSLSVFFTLLISFGLTVQHDYKTSWQYQQSFWTDVVRLAPDLTDGTKIFVEDPSFKSTSQITANAWNVSLILDQLYKFPKEWKNPPNLHVLPFNWSEYILSDDDLFDLDNERLSKFVDNLKFSNFVSDDKYKFKSSNVILLKSQDGKLIRQILPLTIKESVFPLKQLPTARLAELNRGHLYDYLIVDDSKKVEYLN